MTPANDMQQHMEQWPVTAWAGGWLDGSGRLEAVGTPDQPFALASVTKPLFAYAVLVAVEEQSLSLDQPAGPDGSTIAHLLSHSSGLAPETADGAPSSLAAVGSRRIYSNQGFDLLGRALTAATAMDPADYLRLAVLEPLGMTSTTLAGSPAHGARGTVRDLLAFAAELINPTLVDSSTLSTATTAHLPDLPGVLPGFGRQEPNLWGLGFELRGDKQPHWTGSKNSPATFGHFGASGTFLWIDPRRSLACVVLTDRDFGLWAAEVWPRLNDAVIDAHSRLTMP